MRGSRREIAFLTNPAAGRGDAPAARDAAVPRLSRAGFAVRTLAGRDPEETRELARVAVADGADSLVVCGGDGLVHAGVQAVARTGVPLGVVPAGTGNDTARCLGLPRRDPVAAADRIIASRLRRLDLARCGSTWFVTVLAAGFDAAVAERANAMRRPRGPARYHLATLAELRVLAPRAYALELDGERLHREAVLVAVGNGPSFGGGLRIAEGARLDDGLLDVVVIGPLSRTGLLRAYPRLGAGTHTTLPQYEHHRVRTVTVAAPGIVGYADGERLGPLPLTVEADPDALVVHA